jgi:selenocysteine lyase/cysteine desulfurase
MNDWDEGRRGFMQRFAGGALGGLMLSAFPEEAGAMAVRAGDLNAPPGSPGPGDEEFWAVVRQQFPLQSTPIYLNNGTLGPSPLVVQDSIRAETEVVDRTGKYGGWDDVRPTIATFIGAAPEEISLTHNVTEGINVVACGLPLKRGDEVILTDHEHAGNAIPWLARARRDGIVVRTLRLAQSASETLNRLDDLIGARTRVIAVPHVTCTIGQVLPAREISRLGRDRGLRVMLDAAHTPGMLPMDVRDLECDFLASCGHKWLMGPKGTGFLYVRKEMIEALEPYWVGGGSDAGWDVVQGTLSFRKDAHRFDFASQSAALFAGLGTAIDFVRQVGVENVSRRGRYLAGLVRAELNALGEKATVLTPEEEDGRAAIVGFRLTSMPFDKLQGLLREKYGIVTRMVPENGVNCNRVSTHIYNSPDDVQRLAAAIRSVA